MTVAPAVLDRWSSILATPQVVPIPNPNPDVNLWSVNGRYLLRSFGPLRPGASLADEYRVLLHLRSYDVPVAVPIVTDDAHLVVQEAGTNFVLVPRLKVDLKVQPDTYFGVGRSTAALHAALADYPWPVKSYRIDLFDQAFGEAASKLPGDVRAELVDPHRGWASGLVGLPEQLIHGDCHDRNVLVAEGRVSGFIDLDHLPVGPRIYDLAYYLIHGVRRLGDCGRAFLEQLSNYLDGYHAANPLSAAERAAIPAAMLAAEISLTSWNHVLHTEMPYRAAPDEGERYARGLQSLRWITQHLDALETAAAG